MTDSTAGYAGEQEFSFFQRCYIERAFPQIKDAWAIPCDEFVARLRVITELAIFDEKGLDGLEEFRAQLNLLPPGSAPSLPPATPDPGTLTYAR